MTDSPIPLVILGIASALALTSMLAIAWSLAILRKPRALVRGGYWREAAVAAARMGESWLRVFPSVREEAAHVRAACLHLEGNLEESLAACRALRDGALLEGANLVMLGRDAERAVQRLTAACASPRSSPEDLLFLALAKHAAGDTAGAAETFALVARSRPKGAPSPRVYDPAFRYLRGLYLVETGRPGDARHDLEGAAASPVATVYVARARALLASERPPAGDDGDGRSSLTGQVVAPRDA